MILFLSAFLSSFIVTLLVIRFDHLHARHTFDHDLAGAQKFHAHPVPRIGGVGMIVGVAVALLIRRYGQGNTDGLLWGLMGACVPVFVAGFAEDVTKKVRASLRLLAAMVGAGMAFAWIDAGLTHLALPLLDVWLQWTPFALLLTMIAVAGITHAINIIDGFNGLASAVSMMYFAALGYVGYKVGDWLIVQSCLMMIGAILGFFIFNWPRGLIFLGDGGAYFIGFILAELSVLLVARNSQVSAWFPLLLLIYPIIETLFSVYRRKFIRGRSPGLPDGVHLHTLIYRRIARWVFGNQYRSPQNKIKSNSMTSPYLWLLSAVAILPSLFLWQNTRALQIAVVLFGVLYVWLYWRIVRFRTPKILRKF